MYILYIILQRQAKYYTILLIQRRTEHYIKGSALLRLRRNSPFDD